MYFGISGSSTLKGIAAIPWELVRTIAVIQLYLKEKWIEAPEEKPLPYSLLIHQSLAVLASLGERGFDELAEFMLSLPPFKKIQAEDFRVLVAWLEKTGFIGTTEEGTLILGLEGERIVNRHGFYSVFPGDETFRVILDGREIGTVNFVPDPMSVLAVGGQRWTVKSIDGAKREIWVTETEDEGNERLWRGRGGGTDPRIAEMMRLVIAGTEDISAAFPYLSPSARKALEAGREIARDSGIAKYSLVPGEEQTVFLFPWTGSAGMRTIAAVLGSDENKKILRTVFIEEEDDLYFRIVTKFSFLEFQTLFSAVCQKALAAQNLQEFTKVREIPFTDKYDYLLPPKLLAKQYAANMLDITALEKLAGL
jgi:ATP-dependent Lhr-like helicase